MSRNFVSQAPDLDSNFGDDSVSDERRQEERQKHRDRLDQLASKSKASSSVFREEASRDEGRRIRMQYLSLNAYDRHKILVNEYLLCYAGASDKVLKRDTSKDKTDLDIIKEHHKFLWEDQEGVSNLTWEQRLAKKYYEKLFKEYCLCDLSRYKENKVAMRWRTESEVKLGKGQFVCGNKRCDEHETMRTWEVNFAYEEDGDKKNALVKVRLCPDCSYKLNYHHKKKDVTKTKKKKRKEKKKNKGRNSSDSSEDESIKRQKLIEEQKEEEKKASKIWSAPVQVEQEKSRDDDFEEYLEDLFM